MKLKYMFSGAVICLLVYFFVPIVVNKDNGMESEQTLSSQHTELNPISIQYSENAQNGITSVGISPPTQTGQVQILGQPKMNYDEDWCMPYQDLSEENINQYREEIKDWSFQRGQIYLNNEFDADAYNGEYLEPYREEDITTLFELGDKGDRLALIALLQRQGVELPMAYAAAEKLTVMGDTASGLRVQVLKYLDRASTRYNKTKVVDDEIKMGLLSALAMVEIGLERKDTSALGTYIRRTQSIEGALSGLDPELVLTDEDLKEVFPIAQAYKKTLDEQRVEMGLPLLSEIELPRAAYADFDFQIAFLLSEYGERIRDSRVLAKWNKSYLKVTPCVEKQASLFAYK